MAIRTSDPNIDRAIVMTQYDLRGFSHPMGFRMMEKNAKNFDAITCNLMAFAHGRDDNDKLPSDYVQYFVSSYEDYLEMCKRIRSRCSESQREAIQLIIKDMLKYHEALKQNEKGKNAYLKTLTKDNHWGKAMLCLMEAFDVKIE